MKLSTLGMEIDKLVAAGYGNLDVEVWEDVGNCVRRMRRIDGGDGVRIRTARVIDSQVGEVVAIVIDQVKL